MIPRLPFSLPVLIALIAVGRSSHAQNSRLQAAEGAVLAHAIVVGSVTADGNSGSGLSLERTIQVKRWYKSLDEGRPDYILVGLGSQGDFVKKLPVGVEYVFYLSGSANSGFSFSPSVYTPTRPLTETPMELYYAEQLAKKGKPATREGFWALADSITTPSDSLMLTNFGFRIFDISHAKISLACDTDAPVFLEMTSSRGSSKTQHTVSGNVITPPLRTFPYEVLLVTDFKLSSSKAECLGPKMAGEVILGDAAMFQTLIYSGPISELPAGARRWSAPALLSRSAGELEAVFDARGRLLPRLLPTAALKKFPMNKK